MSVPVLSIPLVIQLPTNGPGKATDSVPSVFHCHPSGSQEDKIPVSCLQPGLVLAIVATVAVNQQMEELSVSAFLA